MSQNESFGSTNSAMLITVYGEVKNVGFRRFVWRLAKTLNLKGYVENVLNEDCVRMYVEGCAEKLEELLSRISTAGKAYGITKMEVKEQIYTGKYSDFIIVRCVGEEI